MKIISLLTAGFLAAGAAFPACAQSGSKPVQTIPMDVQVAAPSQALRDARAGLDAAWREGPLAFTAALFVLPGSEGYGDYIARAGSVFRSGQTMVIYAEPVGYGFAGSAGSYSIDLDADIELVIPTGQVILTKKDFSRISLSSRNKQREFRAVLSVAFDGLKPGAYKLNVTLRDANSAKSGRFSLPFTITE